LAALAIVPLAAILAITGAPASPVAQVPESAVDVPAEPPRVSLSPGEVRAVYLNAWAWGSKRLWDLVALSRGTEINAFVLDVKDDTGELAYASSLPLAAEIGASSARVRNPRERLDSLRALGIYTIARIIVAKDPLLAREKPSWAVRDSRGGLWRDRLDFTWVDAFNDSVWSYAADIAAEAVSLGFAEVQFDYVRFPDEPHRLLQYAVFPGRQEGESRRRGVRRNLQLLRARVRALDVPFTIDVFGLTTSAQGDMGIGQVWEDLVRTADVVLPMVYPSHYYRGAYGVAHPNSQPYRIVHQAVGEALERTAASGAPALVRPFLQAFTLGRPRYTSKEIRAQIRAVEDHGVRTWVLWNASGRYRRDALLPSAERARAVAADTTER
jgi:hypothetical protein